MVYRTFCYNTSDNYKTINVLVYEHGFLQKNIFYISLFLYLFIFFF